MEAHPCCRRWCETGLTVAGAYESIGLPPTPPSSGSDSDCGGQSPDHSADCSPLHPLTYAGLSSHALLSNTISFQPVSVVSRHTPLPSRPFPSAHLPSPPTPLTSLPGPLGRLQSTPSAHLRGTLLARPAQQHHQLPAGERRVAPHSSPLTSLPLRFPHIPSHPIASLPLPLPPLPSPCLPSPPLLFLPSPPLPSTPLPPLPSSPLLPSLPLHSPPLTSPRLPCPHLPRPHLPRKVKKKTRFFKRNITYIYNYVYLCLLRLQLFCPAFPIDVVQW